FEAFQGAYSEALIAVLARPRAFAAAFLAFCALSVGIAPFLARDLFPEVDAVIRERIPAAELETVLDNVGLPYSGINLSYSNAGTTGTSDAEILVQLNPGHRPTAEYVRRLREELPQDFPGVEFF